MLLNADKKTDLELVVAFLSFCEHAQKNLGSKGKIFLLVYSHNTDDRIAFAKSAKQTWFF